jgi:orotidine-5'-phosphate decarboxylase
LEFRQFIEEAAKRNKSPIVLALDLTCEARDELFKRALRVIASVSRSVCAVKFNHQIVLPLGLHDRVIALVREAHEHEIPVIMDAKINDIGHTNEFIASQYFTAGFDAVIANPFAGFEDGLEPVFRIAKAQQKGVLLLVHMSHSGASEGYGQIVLDDKGERKNQFEVFAHRAVQWGADGAIVGATFPETIAKAHLILGDSVPIYSPGVGVQGGSLSRALAAGAKYAIVGRSIYESDDPAKSAESLRRSAVSSD